MDGKTTNAAPLQTGREYDMALTPDGRITPEHLESLIVDETYDVIDTTTRVSLKLANGFRVHGESACMVPANFDEAKGRELARARAVAKIWELEGYHQMAKGAHAGAFGSVKGSSAPVMHAGARWSPDGPIGG